MVQRFFDRYKAIIVWIMVIGFFLGAAVFAAFRYVGPSSGNNKESSGGTKQTAILVNGEKITEQQFDSAYQNTIERQKQLYKRFGRDFSSQLEGAAGALRKLGIKSRVADQLIKNALLVQEAEKRGISPSESTVDQKLNSRINEILNNYDWTEEDLKAAVKQQGQTYEEFKKNLRESIRTEIQRQKLRDQIVGEIEPSEKQLKTYLNDNMDNYVQTPAKVKVDHIVTDVQTKAGKIKNKIESGEAPFEELAKKYTEDPSMGWFKKGDKSKKIEEAAFSLDKGEVSEPIKTTSGWEILKLQDKQERIEPALEEIKEKVKSDYVKKEENERFENWYQDIKEKAEIEVKKSLVSARMTYEEDEDEGLKAYEELKNEEGYKYPYLSYYIGRAYQQKAKESSEKLSGDDLPEDVQTESIKQEIETQNDKAFENYMDVIEGEGTDDLDLLKRAWSLDRSNPRINYLLAEENAKQMNMNQAIAYYKRAIKNKEGYVKAMVGYGNFLKKIRRYQKAVEQYKKALKEKENAALRNKLGQTYLKMKKYSQAKQNFQKVLSPTEENFTALKGMGDVAFQQNNFEKATEYYNEALNQKSDTQTQLKLGRAYLQSGDLENAELEFNNVISTHPYSGKAYLGLGDVYKEQGKDEKALQNYRDGLARTDKEDTKLKLSKKVAELAPSNIENRFELAKIYKEKHIYNSALEQYRKILDLDASDQQKREAYLGIGNSFIKKTEYDKAKEEFKKGLKLADTSGAKLTLLKRLLKADEEQHGEEELSSDGLNALLKMAEIYVNQGEKKKAKEKLNRLKKLDESFKPEKVKSLSEKIK